MGLGFYVMRNKHIILVIFTILLIIPGCGSSENISAKESQDRYNYSEDGFIWNYLDTLNVIYESGANYEIFTDDDKTCFYYRVLDNIGSTIDEGYHDWRGSFSFEEINDMLVLNYGFGSSQWQQRYYDVESGRVSRFFQNPIQISNELVAYFTYMSDEIVLIIQNMFDPAIYHTEIRRNFSDFVIKNQCSAEFLEDNGKLKITYWIKPNDEEVTEVIELF